MWPIRGLEKGGVATWKLRRASFSSRLRRRRRERRASKVSKAKMKGRSGLSKASKSFVSKARTALKNQRRLHADASRRETVKRKHIYRSEIRTYLFRRVSWHCSKFGALHIEQHTW